MKINAILSIVELTSASVSAVSIGKRSNEGVIDNIKVQRGTPTTTGDNHFNALHGRAPKPVPTNGEEGWGGDIPTDPTEELIMNPVRPPPGGYIFPDCGQDAFPLLKMGRCMSCPKGISANPKQDGCRCIGRTAYSLGKYNCVCKGPHAKKATAYDYQCTSCTEGYSKSETAKVLKLDVCIPEMSVRREIEDRKRVSGLGVNGGEWQYKGLVWDKKMYKWIVDQTQQEYWREVYKWFLDSMEEGSIRDGKLIF